MSYFTKRATRVVAGTLAGALALSVSPILGLVGTASAADALPPLADPIGAGNFCENMPTTEPFTDVSASDPSVDEIICLVNTELTQGTTATTYSPNASITRRQMALFIKRTADLANELEVSALTALSAYDGTPDYTDHGAENAAFEEAIGQLSQADIVGGFPDGTFRPEAPVSRRQMAAFVNRLEDFLTGTAFSSSGDFFNDDNGDSGEDNLNALASVGVFQGDGAGNVFPGANLTRRQMANILLRHLQVMFDDGDIDGAFAPAPPTTNQTYSVTPVNEARLAFGPASATTSRTFTAAVPASTVVDIQLFPAANVVTSATGTTVYSGTGDAFFVDANSDNIADPGVPAAMVVSVNGVAGTGNNVTSSGSITFVVNSIVPADVIPVVFADAANDSSLNLTVPTPANANAKKPTDAFGVGGRTHFTAPEGALGAFGPALVTEISRTLDYFVTGAFTYEYDANDVFQYGGVGVTMAQFEGLVTVAGANAIADSVGGAYNPDPTGVSTFNAVSPELVPTATAPTAPTPVGEAKNLDAGATANDVVLNWTASTQPDATYTITRDVDNSGAVNAGDVQLATGVTGTTRTFNNEPNSAAVQYLITTVGGTSGVANGTVLSTGTMAVPAAADATAPFSVDALQSSAGGLGGTFDTGDVHKFVFNEALRAPAVGDKIRLTDGDLVPTVADFTNGTNATFALNAAAEVVNGLSRAANTVLTVTLTADPTIVTAGTVVGLQVPATVTDRSGVADVAGNLWSLASSTDLVVDSDAVDTDAVNGAAPTITSIVAPTNGTVAGAITVTVTFSEPVALQTGAVAATVAAGFTYQPTGGATNGTGITIAPNGLSATISFTSTQPVVAGTDSLTWAEPAAPHRILDDQAAAVANRLASFAAAATTN